MKNRFFSVILLFCFIIFSEANVLAVQPAQLLRSDELTEKQQRLQDQILTRRAYVINDYSFSGLNLTAEQSAALKQIVKPVLGSFLKKKEVDKLCGSVRQYIRKDVKPTARISCTLNEDIFKLEASE